MLGFATIGLYLFYFAYRYDLLYVSNADIDTQGKSYVRALQHTTVGCYLSMICLIGLFAMGAGHKRISLGPMILMIILLVFTLLYHISLHQAITPLIEYLPKNLEAEEQALLAHEYPKASPDSDGSPANDGTGASPEPNDEKVDHKHVSLDTAEKGLTASGSAEPRQAPNFLIKYLRPDKYTDYATLRRLIPNPLETENYSEEVQNDAYMHPCINAKPPLLWIPRDDLGVSQREIELSSRVIPITDEGAWLDAKNKVQWNMGRENPPIYEEKVHY